MYPRALVWPGCAGAVRVCVRLYSHKGCFAPVWVLFRSPEFGEDKRCEVACPISTDSFRFHAEIARNRLLKNLRGQCILPTLEQLVR